MGIKNLLPFLKEVTSRSSLASLEGLVAAVDASCWLHKASVVSFKRFGDQRSVIELCRSYLNCIRRNNITAVVVFDGLPLPGKEREHARRKRVREAARQKAKCLQSAGKADEARNVLAGALEIDHKLTIAFVNLCREMSVQYLVAPYEADAQISFLVKNDLVDLAISEDSDLLAYGCKKVLFKFSMQMNGVGDLIELSNVLQHLDLSSEQFLHLCIAAGCDYISNIKNVGINTAHKLVKNSNFFNLLQSMPNAPTGYIEEFKRARAIFLHQTIMEPNLSKTVPLSSWEGSVDSDRKALFQVSCGMLLPQEYSIHLAIGNVNPADRDNIQHTFPKPVQVNMLEPSAIFFKVDCLQDSITWTVPHFPVLDINFTKALSTVRGVQKHILFQQEKSHEIKAGTKISCTKWCNISIDEIIYLVAWDFINLANNAAIDLDRDAEERDMGESEIEDEETATEHTVPFKVLGIMYKDRQTYLKAASEKLHAGYHVQVAIQPQPDNDHDRNAIAVLLEYGCDWKLVGYIAREITCYLHPLINSDSVKVTIAHLRFRVTHFLIGYYLTINITKKGMWCPKVIAASKKVA